MITYKPKQMLKRALPKAKVQKLVTKKLTVNKAVLNSLAAADIVPKGKLNEVALRVLRTYKRRYGKARKAGLSQVNSIEQAVNQKKLMVARVQNAAVFEIAKEIRERYRGDFYEWLPSSAVVPDQAHMENYGSIFRIGRGEMPGDRYGCQCGMRILTEDDLGDLDLEP